MHGHSCPPTSSRPSWRWCRPVADMAARVAIAATQNGPGKRIEAGQAESTA
jgi:hypothetical protein